MTLKGKVSCTLTALSLALCATQSFAMEARVFAISDFVPTGSGGCGGNDISHWDNMVDEWYDQMGSEGHIKDGQHTNGGMTIQRFCDPDWTGGCADASWIDEADTAMIATHGSDSGDHWAGTMRSRWNGHCALDAGGTADDMWVGDYDLEFIHLSSCFSADDDNLSGIREAMYDVVDTPNNGRRAHQWDGFHGIMWIGGSFDDDYEDFADDAHSISMGEAWVSNMYDDTVDCGWADPFGWFGSCQEQCPVAYSIGATESDALSRLNNERYNNVYSDPTGKSWYAYRYIPNCDSKGESAFNP
ncbi:hypothetical protein SAMN02745866_03407 [Alteromonadaceae bacterium Bs31]|nr:hypothetical protein SAMN02745866_03407 [Alteromonadaceae bacterium Bs31]